jgi:peroxiredoxin
LRDEAERKGDGEAGVLGARRWRDAEGVRGHEFPLPAGLPVPEDDGAADHLPGTLLPPLGLVATDGSAVDLSSLAGATIVFAYPRTGAPGVPVPAGWDAIPGARGCTPQACAYRDAHASFAALGARVYGLSTQDTGYQREAAVRLDLPYPLLSDAAFAFTDALRLPTFEFEGTRLLRRLTLVVRDGTIERVRYPVFPSDGDAAEALRWLRNDAGRSPTARKGGQAT